MALNYCINGIYIQSIDDFISYEVRKIPSLLYADLSENQQKLQPIVFTDSQFQFKKQNSIQLSQDDTFYYVIA